MIVAVPVTDPRPGAPLLRHGPWSINIALPGTFKRLPEGPRVSVAHAPPHPASVRRVTPYELEGIVDHVVSVAGYGEQSLTIQTRSWIRALLNGVWWLRRDVETAIDELRVLSARAS